MPTIQISNEQLAVLLGNPLFVLVVGAAVVLLSLLVVLLIVRSVMRKRYQARVGLKKKVLLVTVPKESAEKGDAGQREKSLQEIQEDIGVMETIFASIGGLKAEKGTKAWYVGREDSISFEIVANDGLISFYVATPENLQEFIVQQIQAQYPHAQVEEVPDYNIFHPQGQVVGTMLKFRRDSFFSLKTFKQMETDPLNSLTNAMAKVEKGDGAVVQIVVRSARPGWRAQAASIVKAMHQGKSYNEARGGTTMMGTLGGMFKSSGKPEEKKEYRMSSREEEMVKAIEEKIGKLGLDVCIRVIASSSSQAKATNHLNNIVGAFAQYNIPQYGNQFARYGLKTDRLVDDLILRRFPETPRMVLTGEELAGIFHLPLPSTETPNIRWLLARKAPPPSNIPQEGLYLGTAEYRGQKTEVFIKHEDRFRHIYLIGSSGSGKSEYIANMAAQDVRDGHGICIVDPHGDLAETVLATVPKERADDVVIFDPSDTERPVGLNMIEAPSEEARDFVVGEMIAIFYKLFPPEMIGPMFEHNMRNFMLTLMSDAENPGTIAEIPRLISDAEYQKEWLAKVTDPVVRSFWENEIAKTSDFHKSEMLGYLISKVGRFVENAMMRNIIGQQKSGFDFRDIMDNKKIFLINLSKGKIGDVNANLLGLIIVTKLQMAAMARADMPKEERKDFFLYIDEFQNFITPSIATILSEARKYRLSLIMAHQYMGQLAPKGDTEIRDAVLGNVGTKLVGRIGIDDSEILEKEFTPVFSALDLMNVDKFHWNTKILIDNTVSRPFVVKAPMPVKGNPKLAAAIKQLSRLKYGRDKSIVEQEILERTQLGATVTQGPEQSVSV